MLFDKIMLSYKVLISELLVTCKIVNDRMPTDAVIPSTPLSLLPFLNKMNEQWTSDLETPQAQIGTKPTTSSTRRVMQLFTNSVTYCIVVHCFEFTKYSVCR